MSVMFLKIAVLSSLESNKAPVVAFLEVIQILISSFESRVVVERDSLNIISWVSSSTALPWRYQFNLNEIRALSSLIQVVFRHVRQLANGFADALEKKGDGAINPKYFKVYQRQQCKKKVADQASLWMDQPLMGSTHQDHKEPPLDMFSEEDPQFDLSFLFRPFKSCGN